MIIWTIFITALVAAIMIVNWEQQMYMKLMGANMMFFSEKKKLIAIDVIALVLTTIILQIFGIEIPK